MRNKIVIPLLLVALGFNIGIGLGAVAQNTVYLALFATAETPTTVTTLVNWDCNFPTAYVLPGTSRIIVTYIDRAHRNLLHVTEDVGSKLVEIPLPPISATADLADTEPQFIPPGPKHGNGATVVVNGVFKVYYVARDVGDLTGPFKLKRIDMPVPLPAKP